MVRSRLLELGMDKQVAQLVNDGGVLQNDLKDSLVL